MQGDNFRIESWEGSKGGRELPRRFGEGRRNACKRWESQTNAERWNNGTHMGSVVETLRPQRCERFVCIHLSLAAALTVPARH
eukprot:3865605-Rhodomonas_salina.1